MRGGGFVHMSPMKIALFLGGHRASVWKSRVERVGRTASPKSRREVPSALNLLDFAFVGAAFRIFGGEGGKIRSFLGEPDAPRCCGSVRISQPLDLK